MRWLRPAQGELPSDLRPLVSPATTFQVEVGRTETVARGPDGRIAWVLHQEGPQLDEHPAVEPDGVIVVAATTGDLVALDVLDPWRI